jgi:hypothetical protein
MRPASAGTLAACALHVDHGGTGAGWHAHAPTLVSGPTVARWGCRWPCVEDPPILAMEDHMTTLLPLS